MRKCFKVVSVLLSALLLVGVLDSVSFADDEFLPREQRVVKGGDIDVSAKYYGPAEMARLYFPYLTIN